MSPLIGRCLVAALLSLSARAWSAEVAFQNVLSYVPLQIGAQSVNADLDGDGSSEIAWLAPGGDYDRSSVVSVLRWDAGTSRYEPLNGVLLPSSFDPQYGKLLVYRRSDGSGADGLAVVTRPGAEFSAGVLLEGIPLQQVKTLQDFALEPVIAVGDVTGDGKLDVFTDSAAGIDRWPIDGLVPDLEVDVPECIWQFGNRCQEAVLANFDADPVQELLVSGSSTYLLDATNLQPKWTRAEALRYLHAANVDGDAALEFAGATDATPSSFEVFDASGTTPLATIPQYCFQYCPARDYVLADMVGHDGRAELMYVALGELFRHSLPSGAAVAGSPMIWHDDLSPWAADVDGDGAAELFFADGAALDVLEPTNLVATHKLYVNYSDNLDLARWWQSLAGPRLLYGAGPNGGAGAVTAAQPELPLVDWQSPSRGDLGARALYDIGVGNADDDGVEDIYLLTDMDVVALSGATHQVLWRISTRGPPPDLLTRGIRRMLVGQLDGDSRSELILGFEHYKVEGWDAPSGAVLWSTTASQYSSIPSALSFAQLDQDPALEVLMVSDHVMGFDPGASTPLFDLPVGGSNHSAAVAAGANGPLLYVYEGSYGPPFIHAYHVPGLEPAGVVPGYFGWVLGIATVPGKEVLVLSEDGGFTALDAISGAVLAKSAFHGDQLGYFGNMRVAQTSTPGVFKVVSGSNQVYVEDLLSIDPPMFADGFE